MGFYVKLLSKISLLFVLSSCNQEPIATVTYPTPDGVRELYAYPPPIIKNTNNLSEVTQVNIVFCRWFGGYSKVHFGSEEGIPEIGLKCNFDTAPQKQLSYRRPTFLSMEVRWKNTGNKKYQMSKFQLKTPTPEIKISANYNNCSRKNCGLEVHHLVLPNLREEELKFHFSFNTAVIEDIEYAAEFVFQGSAPRTPGR